MKKLLLTSGGLLLLALGLNAQTTYFSQDFESGSMPAGWTPAGTWTVGDAATSSSANFPIPAHTYFAVVNDDASQNAANANARLRTPVINLSAATTVYLKFDVFFAGLSYNNITETANIDYSTDGGTTWTTSTIVVPTSGTGWNTVAANMSAQLAGQSNVKIGFRYHDGNDWLYGCAVDNVTLFEPAANDAALSAISPPMYGAANSTVSFTGTIQNNGLNAITSIVAKYSDGSNTYTSNINAINVASFATYNFTHSVPYTIPAVGTHNITMWVELTGDGSHANDTLTTVVNGVSFLPTHHVVFEEGTGTWCGWCPRGTVYMDSMHAVHPTTTHLIAVHNGDPMVNAAYDGGIGALIAGYPSALANRSEVIDPSDMFTAYNATINDFGFANLTPTVTFNNVTRACQVDVAAQFATSLNGDYRLAVVFTEDSVYGSAANYGQTNYYAGGGNGPMGGFESLPATVPASQMHYDFVARQIVGGFTGMAGSLPAAIVDGNTYNYTFNWTIPAAQNVSKMHVTVLLIDNESNVVRILNAAGASIPLSVSEQTGTIAQMLLFPNPSANGNINLNYTLSKADAPVVEVVDAMGRVVYTENIDQKGAGDHTLSINTANLAAGVYALRMVTTTGTMTRAFQITN